MGAHDVPREEPGTTVQKAEELSPVAGPKTGRKKTLSQSS